MAYSLWSKRERTLHYQSCKLLFFTMEICRVNAKSLTYNFQALSNLPGTHQLKVLHGAAWIAKDVLYITCT